MQHTLPIEQVDGHVAELLSFLPAGDEIVITREEQRLGRLVAEPRQSPADSSGAAQSGRASILAAENLDSMTLEELVAAIAAIPPAADSVRPGVVDRALIDRLLSERGEDAETPEQWIAGWEEVEREMKAVERANDLAEGQGE